MVALSTVDCDLALKVFQQQTSSNQIKSNQAR